MLSYRPPASETARQWLDKFHDEKLMADKPVQGAFIPLESAPLAGLKEPNRQAIWTYVEFAQLPFLQRHYYPEIAPFPKHS